MTQQPAAKIAYSSMEIAADERVPTYSGGLGVLAGDVLRAAADLELPMVGITLVHRLGYFHQTLDEAGKQSEKPEPWHPENALELAEPTVTVALNNRKLYVRAWRYWITGITGHKVPVYFL